MLDGQQALPPGLAEPWRIGAGAREMGSCEQLYVRKSRSAVSRDAARDKHARVHRASFQTSARFDETLLLEMLERLRVFACGGNWLSLEFSGFRIEA